MDLLEEIQTDLEAYLKGSAELQFVQIIVTRPRVDADGNPILAPDIQATLDNALMGLIKTNNADPDHAESTGKNGAAILIQMPTEKLIDHQQIGTALQTSLKLVFVASEYMLINNGADGTKLSCETMANSVLLAVHGWRCGGMLLKCEGKAPRNFGNDAILCYEVGFTGDAVRTAPPRVESVRPKLSGNSLTLTTLTPGAAIYYRLDGKLPTPADTLYAGAVALTSPVSVRAMAYLDGSLPSNLFKMTF